MNFTLSPSSLNLMQECPRCFWLTQHKVWKRPRGIFPSLPSGMDKILKTHFDSFAKNNTLPPELKENKDTKNLKLFKNEILSVWRNNRKGIIWTKNNNTLRGAVDNILEKGKKLIVLDYKTRGYPTKEDTASHYKTQLSIYNLLLRKNNYKTENYAFLLFYIPKEVLPTGEVVFDTELKKIKTSPEEAELLFNKALLLLSKNCPKTACEWCKRV